MPRQSVSQHSLQFPSQDSSWSSFAWEQYFQRSIATQVLYLVDCKLHNFVSLSVLSPQLYFWYRVSQVRYRSGCKLYDRNNDTTIYFPIFMISPFPWWTQITPPYDNTVCAYFLSWLTFFSLIIVTRGSHRCPWVVLFCFLFYFLFHVISPVDKTYMVVNGKRLCMLYAVYDNPCITVFTSYFIQSKYK